jgi:hypothetical protein
LCRGEYSLRSWCQGVSVSGRTSYLTPCHRETLTPVCDEIPRSLGMTQVDGGRGLLHLAACGHRPVIDDLPVADHDQLIGEIDGRADVVRDDLDSIADIEAGLSG